jgi:hypothetical protein
MSAMSGAANMDLAARTVSTHARGVGVRESALALVRDPLRMAVFLLTIFTVSRVHEHYSVLKLLRPALLLVVASCVYAYLNPRHLTSANVLRIWPMRRVAILGAFACISAPFGLSLGGSAAFILGSYVKTLAYAFLVAVSIRHARDLFTFVWAYVVSCGILAFFSIFVFGISRGANSYVMRLNNLYTYDSNDLCVIMMVGLPLNLLLLSVAKGTKRWLLLLTLMGISASLARSGSRGGFLGFIAVALALLVLVKGVPAAQRLFIVTTAIVVLAIAAPPGYWEQMRTIMSPKQDYNYTEMDGRKAVSERGISYMLHYPVFGLGISNFYRAECSISPKLESLRINGPMRCTAPHNSYVEAGAELGIPGLLIWLSLVIGGIVAPLRLRRHIPPAWRRGTETERFIYSAASFLPVSMVGFAATSFFVSFAWRDPVYILAAFTSGLYVALRVQMRAASGPDGASVEYSKPRLAGWRVRETAWRARQRQMRAGRE